MTLTIELSNEKQQQQFGEQLAMCCVKPVLNEKECVIYLTGELGAGKTTLARGFLEKLGVRGKIKSPTYSLVECYELIGLYIFHVDLYRISHPREVQELGLTQLKNDLQYTDSSIIALIEWPEKALKQLPPPDITCSITLLRRKRRCFVAAHTEKGRAVVLAMNKSIGENQ